MGKKENIRRARLLKEAKRKREQESLTAAGMGPAGLVLQKRVEAGGSKIMVNLGKVRYSDLLKEFADPIISDSDPLPLLKTKCLFAAQAWNAAIIKEIKEDLYIEAKEKMMQMAPEIAEMDEVFEELVKRKLEDFSEYKNIIADLEIKRIDDNNYDLTVATTPLKDGFKQER